MRALRVTAVAVVLGALTMYGIAASSAVSPASQWQWQLSTPPTNAQVDALPAAVKMVDIDGFDSSAATVARIKARGMEAVCYFSAGSSENWRPDFNRFPASVKGRSNGWSGEKWLDIRNLSVLGPIMSDRMKMCASKGFTAVEPDNVDGYTNRTGFPLTAAHQLEYNKYLANLAHGLGLQIYLKNDVDQVVALQPYFDGAINEQCFQYNECNVYKAFSQAGKFVGVVEYKGLKSSFCPTALANGWSAMKKTLELTATRDAC